MKISKQRIIANALKNSEYDLASWPEDTLNSLSDLILAALGAAEFIQTEGETLNSEGWKKIAFEKGAEVDELKHLIGEMEHGDAIIAKRADRMRKALEFYANPYTYTVSNLGAGKPFGYKIEEDKGDRAREALVDYT